MTVFSLQSLCRLCSLLVVLAPAAQAAEDIWVKYASENFVIYTASSSAKAEKVLRHLERVRRAYALMLDAELGGESPVNVLLFRSQKEYLEFAPTKTSNGFYTQALGRDFIGIADFNEYVERTLNHEYFHLYARHKGFDWPTWANEGFADYFSTLKLGERTLDVGYPIENHMRYLNNTGRKLNAESLFAMSSEQRHVAGTREVSDLYAMGWTLVHFIMSDSDLATRRGDMLAALQQHDDSGDAFEQVYGWDLNKVDDQLRSYIQRSTMNYTRIEVEKGQLTFDAPVAVAELKEWEAPLLLADLKANARKYDEAEKDYLRLSELYPDAPDIDDSRALLLRRRGQREGMGPLLRAAVAKGSTNPSTYQFLVYSDCQNSATAECLELTRKAVELSPDDNALKFIRINLLNQADEFLQALLLANKVRKVAAEDAPQLFYQAAYSHYRLGETEQAKQAIDRALQHVVSPSDRLTLEGLKEAIERPQPASRALAVTDGGQPILTRRKAPAPPPSRTSAPSVVSVAQRQVNSLVSQGVTLAEAQLKNLDCATAPPALSVDTEAGTMRILIDDPASVAIIRDGAVAVDFQFTCGAQSGENIRVGYSSSSDGSPGVFLRLLQFGEIQRESR